MNYDLAKKLKDAGFPHDWTRFEEHDEELLKADWGTYGKRYSPTLSELIEACGGRYWLSLRYSPTTKLEVSWVAIQHFTIDAEDKIDSAFGSTPDEAVANLWLALNKK